jgi:hypothetical protein
MSYSKDHSRRNPLSPGRMYGLTSSANTNEFTPNGQQTTSTEEVKTSEPTTTVTKEKVEGGTNVNTNTLAPKEIKKVTVQRGGPKTKLSDDDYIQSLIDSGHTKESIRENPGLANLSYIDRFPDAESDTTTSTEFVPDPIKMERIEPQPITFPTIEPTIRRIETGGGEEFEEEEEEVKIKKERRGINLPEINFNLPTFQKKPKKTKSVYGVGKNGMQKTRKKNKNTQGRRKKKNKR